MTSGGGDVKLVRGEDVVVLVGGVVVGGDIASNVGEGDVSVNCCIPSSGDGVIRNGDGCRMIAVLARDMMSLGGCTCVINSFSRSYINRNVVADLCNESYRVCVEHTCDSNSWMAANKVWMSEYWDSCMEC